VLADGWCTARPGQERRLGLAMTSAHLHLLPEGSRLSSGTGDEELSLGCLNGRGAVIS
jgi:hypothetical protein